MLALCLMLLATYYAQNYAGIISWSLVIKFRKVPCCHHLLRKCIPPQCHLKSKMSLIKRQLTANWLIPPGDQFCLLSPRMMVPILPGLCKFFLHEVSQLRIFSQINFLWIIDSLLMTMDVSLLHVMFNFFTTEVPIVESVDTYNWTYL